MSITGMNHAVLYVRDSNRHRQFYEDVLAFTMVIDEISAKVRTGGPNDDPEDLDSPVWAGVVPLAMVAGQPVADPELPEGIPIPDYLLPYRS